LFAMPSDSKLRYHNSDIDVTIAELTSYYKV
jgi:hypothetical protein